MRILGLQKTTLLDYPGRVASTIFTGGCNFRCPYCQNGDLVLKIDGLSGYTDEEIFDHLKKRKTILTGLAITGGEPTLQPDLEDFAARVKQLGYDIKLDTNGSDPDKLSRMISCGLVDYVAMDIKHSREKYDSVVCHPYSLEKIEQSVEILLQGSVDYEFRTTVCKELHSAEDLASIGQWISGAKNYYLQSYRESEAVINPIYSAYEKETLEGFVELLRPMVEHVELRGVD